MEDSSDTKYFFTQLKKLKPHHRNFNRKLIGGGSWKGKVKGRSVGAKKVGIKRTYTYEQNKKDGKDEVHDISWIMKEYSLNDKCYIRSKVKDKESGNHMPKTTAGENDDDTQPLGPNKSRYGDQIPQQMVKPMQNIESRYIGCDDERYDNTTPVA
ncbi:hypothetical protein KY290_013417 [Solanum tuberosum]|uniref:NAC domain-containing protein n=1 Tax=Solanum tuberosum TaxID=4113 RepID=A0ABQ7VLM7_SOLTU|nr:hypothetical protein KY285_012881 [Solanum tuberosum]KAH0769436.1 hypothetical protein KY290_013417 [Solanum tuberosum]